MIIGAGETSELTAQALAEQGVAHDLRRQPPRRPRARGRRALRRRGRLARRAARAARARRHRRLPRPPRRTRSSAPRSSSWSCARARGRPLRADRHRRAARHRPGLRASSTASRSTTSTTCRPSSPATSRCARARRARAEAIVEEEIQRFARWLGAARRRCRRSPRCASTATTIVDQVLAENAGRWESASPRDLARIEAIARAVMQPPAARADDPPEGRSTASAATAAWQLLRELFGARGAPARDGRRDADAAARRRPPAARAGVRHRHPRQRARAGAGAAGRRGARRRRELVGRSRRRRRPRARAAPTRRAGCASSSGAARRRDRPRRALGQGRPGRARRRARARRRRRREPTPRDALCGAAVARRAAPRRARRHEHRCAARPSCARCATDLEIVELRGNVDTRLRKLAERRASTRSCSPRAGLRAPRPRGRGRRGARPSVRPRAGPGHARARGPRRRRATRARGRGDRRRRRRARACAPSARSSRALDADCDTPVGAHATRGDGDALTLRAFVGPPDGSAWVRDELRGDADDPEALGARGRASGCSRAGRGASVLGPDVSAAERRARLPGRRRARRPRPADARARWS